MPKKKGKAKEAHGYCLKQSIRTTKPVLGALYDSYFERPNETMKDSLCKMWPFGRLRDKSKAVTAPFMRSSLTKTFSTYNILRTVFVLFN